jgi:hypothetical protein
MARAKRSEQSGAARDPESEPPRTSVVTGADVAQRAYHLFLARGGEHGHDVEDWLQAERELDESAPAALA